MVFFNYATMQMAAKIVYYGPGLCGKTTNLHHIYAKTSSQSRGEMVSLETETDRTLFFDLLPIDVGVIGGFKTRLQLYTVPGQVFYNTTRKLVLKGVDGIVFVADSQAPMLEANVESLKNLRENLAEIGVDLDELPLVVQLNKRDLPNVTPVDRMMSALDPDGRLDFVESVASTGVGVFETLKQISKLTLRTLRRRMTGEEPMRGAAPAARSTGGQFKVRADTAPIRAMPQPAPASQPVSQAAEIEQELRGLAVDTLEDAPAPPPVVDAPAAREFNPDETIAAPSIFITPPVAEAPVEVPEPEPEPFGDEPEPEAFIAPEPEPIVEPDPVPAPPPVPEPEVGAEAEAEPVIEEPKVPEPTFDFGTAEPAPIAEPAVKTVKVRNSVDVMSELENLRKRATQTTPRAPKRDVFADLESLRPKRDLLRTLHMQLPPDLLPRTRSVRVTLSFEDENGGALNTQDQQLELGETADVQSLSVNLKIDLS
jgi:signal recognition particle receptor subunit beta